MPKQNRAAAAIMNQSGSMEVFIDLVSELVHRFEQYALRRDSLQQKGSTLKHRLFAARAMEVASILTVIMTKRGDREAAQFWEHRRKMNEGIAFNHRNPLAASLGIGAAARSDDEQADNAPDQDD